MHVDFIIVGQGISGTLLSRELLAAGQTVLVIDDHQPITASKIASGVINPVTGKKFVTTWMATPLLNKAKEVYESLGKELQLQIMRECDILNFHPTQDAAALFEAREQEDDTYLYHVNQPGQYEPQFNFHFGIGAVSPGYLIDVAGLLVHWGAYLTGKNALLEDSFNFDLCSIKEEAITYKAVTADHLVFCEGAIDIDNPYFTRLNFQLNKGEAIIAAINDLPADRIYKHGPISIVPWKENMFWIGSTFDREYTDDQPSAAFRQLVEHTLNNWLRLPYSIVDHKAAIRPATGGQKPFVGMHPVYRNVGIFNGMGSKGCSLAPYFAAEFVAHLLNGAPLTPDADIQRFARILSRP